MSKKDSGAGCIVGLLIFIVFGLFFTFKIPFMLSQFMSFFPVIVIFIFILGAVGASSEKSKHCKPIQNYQHRQQLVPLVNPYIVRSSVRKDVQSLLVEEHKPIESTELKVLFCQFCGTRIDKDARFCHQCGSKLE